MIVSVTRLAVGGGLVLLHMALPPPGDSSKGSLRAPKGFNVEGERPPKA